MADKIVGMRATRQVHGVLVEARSTSDPVPGPGVALAFGPPRGAGSRAWQRLGCQRARDFAPLGDADDVESLLGLARVVRILRAGRIAPPADPRSLLGRPERAAAWLQRACGTRFVLLLRPRASLRFTAWTEAGVASVGDVARVDVEPDAYWVQRRRGAAVRIPRPQVVRTATECESWYEVAALERA